MIRLSLTTRFLLTLVLSAALPLVAFGAFALAGMRERMEERLGDVYLPQVAAEAAARVASLLDGVRRSLSLLVAPAAGALRDHGRLGEFESQVRLLPGVHQDFDLILLIDGAGLRVHALHNPGLDPTIAAERLALLPRRFAGESWFRALAAGGGEAWLDRHISPLLHRNAERGSRDPADHHLGLALPVPATDAGVLFALVRWQRVQEVVDAAVTPLRLEGALPSAQGMLCDPSGRVLAHTDRGRYDTTLDAAAARAALTADRRAAAAFQLDAEIVRAGLAPVSGLPGGLRWWTGVTVAERELFASSREFATLLWATLGVLIAVLVAWSLVAARAIVRPVRVLADATERIAAGDLAVRVQPRGQGELAELGRAFDTMAEELARGRDQLRQAERQAAWAEMARQVAHEIKNPLTPMRMSAQLLQRARRAEDPRWPELADRLAKTVQQQTEALAAIAAEFRSFAGPAAVQRAPVPVGALLDAVAALLQEVAAAQQAQLEVRGAGAAVVDGDAQQLRRVFVNLVQNALDAGARSVVLAQRSADDHVEVSVTDDGPGVPDEVRARLFEPYFTSKSSGTGLGLAISRRIVEAHGGEIDLRSTRPGATVFVVRLPRVG